MNKIVATPTQNSIQNLQQTLEERGFIADFDLGLSPSGIAQLVEICNTMTMTPPTASGRASFDWRICWFGLKGSQIKPLFPTGPLSGPASLAFSLPLAQSEGALKAASQFYAILPKSEQAKVTQIEVRLTRHINSLDNGLTWHADGVIAVLNMAILNTMTGGKMQVGYAIQSNRAKQTSQGPTLFYPDLPDTQILWTSGATDRPAYLTLEEWGWRVL